MDLNAVPTKGNLIAAKNSLALAKQGFELMDKKRNILVREIMDLNAKAKDIQDDIDKTLLKLTQLWKEQISNLESKMLKYLHLMFLLNMM